MPVATRSNPTTFQLLQSCKLGQGRVLEEERTQRILEAEVHLAIQDPCGMLQLLLDLITPFPYGVQHSPSLLSLT